MAKSDNQKLKLLYIKKMLEEKTDENHVISTQQIIDELAKYDIKAERKSIYSDIDMLIRYGMDIVLRKDRRTAWSIHSIQSLPWSAPRRATTLLQASPPTTRRETSPQR